MTSAPSARRPLPARPSWGILLWGWLFNLAIYAIMGVVALNTQQLILRARLGPDSSLLANFGRLLVALVSILLLTSAIHEIGHVVAGRLAGLRLHTLVIGPLQLVRTGQQFKLQLNRQGAWFNGLAASIPVEDHDLRRRMLLFALGGPVASLLLVALATLLYILLRENAMVAASHVWLVEACLTTAVISFVFFLSSMKPGAYQNGLPADGGRILMLWRHDDQARRWCALVALNSADFRGRRPCEWDADLVTTALSLPDQSADGLNARLMGYRWALDNGRSAEASALLAETMSMSMTWLSGSLASLSLERAFFMARYQDNPVEARTWLQHIRKKAQTHALYHRAQAAILLAEGESEAAAAAAHAGLKALGKQQQTGQAKAEAAWLREIIAEAAQLGAS